MQIDMQVPERKQNETDSEAVENQEQWETDNIHVIISRKP